MKRSPEAEQICDRLRLASLIIDELTQDIEPQPEQDLSDPRLFLKLSKNERDKLNDNFKLHLKFKR